MEVVRRMLAPLESRIRLMLSRAVVSLINDAAKAQELQVNLLADETQDGVERWQNYGFTSHPLPGAEALVGCVSGLRSHAVAIVVQDRRFRLVNLQPGEVALYDDLGNVVHLAREEVLIEGAAKVRVVAPVVIAESDDVQLGGEGGAKVARVGDAVDPATNKIIEGSDKVRAA